MAGFPVTGLRSVDVDVPDLDAALGFYTGTWGLTLAGRTATTAWLRGTGTDPHLLALHAAKRTAIRSITFRARDRTVAAPERSAAPEAGRPLAAPGRHRRDLCLTAALG